MYFIKHCPWRINLNCKTTFLCTAFRIASTVLFIISPWDISLEANVLSAEEALYRQSDFEPETPLHAGMLISLGSCWSLSALWTWPQPSAQTSQVRTACLSLACQTQFCPRRVHIRIVWHLPPSHACWLPSPFLLAYHADFQRWSLRFSPALSAVRPASSSLLLPFLLTSVWSICRWLHYCHMKLHCFHDFCMHPTKLPMPIFRS